MYQGAIGDDNITSEGNVFSKSNENKYFLKFRSMGEDVMRHFKNILESLKNKKLSNSAVHMKYVTKSVNREYQINEFSRILIVLLVLVTFIVCPTPWVEALEPPTEAEIEQYRADGTFEKRMNFSEALGNHKASPSFVARSKYKLQSLSLKLQGLNPSEIDRILAPPPAWQGMPTTGTVKVLTLLIAFSDFPFGNSASSISSKIYGGGSGGYPYESLHNYYDRSSYSQLNIQGNALGWYTTLYPRNAVSQTTTGRQNLIKEVLDHYDAVGHDFTQYDNDDDGYIDYVIIIWTGPDTGWGNFWWGYMTTFPDPSFSIDGKRLRTYSWQWESRPYPGAFNPLVVIHETGHALGLPDLYDYNDGIGPRGGVGKLDMMDGNWGDHNCFSKFVLDWLTPTTVNAGSQTVTLNASGSTQDAVLVMPGAVQGNQFDEFFMIQNRYRVDNDTRYPNDGFLIWHIDSTLNSSGWNYLYDNSYTSHKLVRLMEADGLEEIERNLVADAGDYYTLGDTFGPDTTPASAAYDGSATGISVSNISASGPVMTADVSLDGTVYAYCFESDGWRKEFDLVEGFWLIGEGSDGACGTDPLLGWVYGGLYGLNRDFNSSAPCTESIFYLGHVSDLSYRWLNTDEMKGTGTLVACSSAMPQSEGSMESKAQGDGALPKEASYCFVDTFGYQHAFSFDGVYLEGTTQTTACGTIPLRGILEGDVFSWYIDVPSGTGSCKEGILYAGLVSSLSGRWMTTDDNLDGNFSLSPCPADGVPSTDAEPGPLGIK